MRLPVLVGVLERDFVPDGVSEILLDLEALIVLDGVLLDEGVFV